MDRVKVALVGAGSMANLVHYPSLSEIERAEMVAACDLKEDRVRSTAERFDIPGTYTDYRQMIEEVKPEAVYVIMPPHHLFDIVTDCLSRGLHVFIEKPPGITSYQTESMARLAGEKACLTMVGFNRRFIPLMQRVRAMAERRGDVVHAVATFYKNYLGQPPYYGGAIDILTCDAIHSVDALRWICGEPVKLASIIRRVCSGYENVFMALIQFESGCSGVLMANWAGGSRIHTFEIHTPGFSAFINPDEGALIYDSSDEPVSIKAEDAAGSQEYHRIYGFYDENLHFIQCVSEERQPLTNFDDAAKTMKLVDLIYRSTI